MFLYIIDVHYTGKVVLVLFSSRVICSNEGWESIRHWPYNYNNIYQLSIIPYSPKETTHFFKNSKPFRYAKKPLLELIILSVTNSLLETCIAV